MADTMVAAKAVDVDAEEAVVVAGEEDATPKDLRLSEVANIASLMVTVRTRVPSVTLRMIRTIQVLLLQTCSVEARPIAFDGVEQHIMKLKYTNDLVICRRIIYKM